MYLPSHADSTALAQLSRRTTLPVASRVVVQTAYLIAIWTQRHRTRRALRHMSFHRLDDIGQSPRAAHREYYKPFWRP